MKKFLFLAGLAIGFVLGSRAGRGPYDSLEQAARQVAEDPEVQRRAGQARETAEKAAHDAAATVKEKAPEVAAAAQVTATGAVHRAKDTISGAGKDSEEDLSDVEISDEVAAAAGIPQDDETGGDGESSDGKPLSS
ncbi:MAG TPA: hypothetical protein H9837_12385 [Candidatus Brachybacterium merdigallinarum]|nr:hypothetical protein [Candidatus Brachybacterium merdigallinarum]